MIFVFDGIGDGVISGEVVDIAKGTGRGFADCLVIFDGFLPVEITSTKEMVPLGELLGVLGGRTQAQLNLLDKYNLALETAYSSLARRRTRISPLFLKETSKSLLPVLSVSPFSGQISTW